MGLFLVVSAMCGVSMLQDNLEGTPLVVDTGWLVKNEHA